MGLRRFKEAVWLEASSEERGVGDRAGDGARATSCGSFRPRLGLRTFF